MGDFPGNTFPKVTFHLVAGHCGPVHFHGILKSSRKARRTFHPDPALGAIRPGKTGLFGPGHRCLSL